MLGVAGMPTFSSTGMRGEGGGPLCHTLILAYCHLNGLFREETQESTLGWHTYPDLRLGHVMSPKARQQGLTLGVLGF